LSKLAVPKIFVVPRSLNGLRAIELGTAVAQAQGTLALPPAPVDGRFEAGASRAAQPTIRAVAERLSEDSWPTTRAFAGTFGHQVKISPPEVESVSVTLSRPKPDASGNRQDAPVVTLTCSRRTLLFDGQSNRLRVSPSTDVAVEELLWGVDGDDSRVQGGQTAFEDRSQIFPAGGVGDYISLAHRRAMTWSPEAKTSFATFDSWKRQVPLVDNGGPAAPLLNDAVFDEVVQAVQSRADALQDGWKPDLRGTPLASLLTTCFALHVDPKRQCLTLVTGVPVVHKPDNHDIKPEQRRYGMLEVHLEMPQAVLEKLTGRAAKV
jgi:hypothetical protein